MNSKKGFTLVELIGVIVILGLLAALITPVVTRIIKRQRESLYDSQLALIIDGARNYVSDNSDTLDIDSNGIMLHASDLYDKGYINSNVTNPKTGEDFDACVAVYWDETNNQNKYEYDSDCILKN